MTHKAIKVRKFNTWINLNAIALYQNNEFNKKGMNYLSLNRACVADIARKLFTSTTQNFFPLKKQGDRYYDTGNWKSKVNGLSASGKIEKKTENTRIPHFLHPVLGKTLRHFSRSHVIFNRSRVKFHENHNDLFLQ